MGINCFKRDSVVGSGSHEAKCKWRSWGQRAELGWQHPLLSTAFGDTLQGPPSILIQVFWREDEEEAHEA